MAAATVTSAGISAVSAMTLRKASSQPRLDAKAAPSTSLLLMPHCQSNVAASVGSLRPSMYTSSRLIRSVTAQASSSSSSSSPPPQKPINVPEIQSEVEETFFFQRALLTATASLTPFLLTAQDAYAAGGEYGILEGRIFSLIHPAVMLALFTATGYAGYLGWQWRRVRTLQDEINALKKQVPAPAEGQAPSPLEGQIKQLSETRKELVKGGFRDRHFNWGSILLGAGVLFSVSGAVNTFIRTGKLFPGPHLYAGVGITVLWALAAALVPPMQKGNDTARSLHIALNTLNLLLFVWQIPTGWEIVLKVLEFTKFP